MTGSRVAPADRDAVSRSAFPRFVLVFAPFLFEAFNEIGMDEPMRVVVGRFIEVVCAGQIDDVAEIGMPCDGKLELDQGHRSERGHYDRKRFPSWPLRQIEQPPAGSTRSESVTSDMEMTAQ
jgi:hypothetical protein